MVCSIFKEEQHRILIGTADFFTRNNANENILGWVNESHVIKWNGRLALECNWEEPSYSQRQNDSLKRVYGFTSQLSADLYGKTGSLNSAHIIWDNDPAKSDYSQKLRSDENNRRKVGEVFRFPVWNITSGYYSSMALLKLDLDLDLDAEKNNLIK
ncbi:MAG: hypothetical protein IPI53_15770 [Saprospiraceae bacterium]|nr:hypothetical protein [Saprospiraceae bacterium]